MSTPFYDLASLVVVPSGYKASKVYAQKPLTTDGQLTFSRASTATRVNSAGLIETVSSNVPRLDYLGSTCPKLQLEPQRVNLRTHSSDFSNLSPSNVTVDVDNTTSPDGTTNADKITPSGSGYHTVGNSISVTAGQKYTISVFYKYGTHKNIGFYDNNTAGSEITINMETNAFTLGGSVEAGGVVPYGNGWYRAYATFTAGNANMVNYIIFRDNTNNGNYTADGSYSWFYGWQVEAGAYPTSLIQTTTAAVTRLADTASKTGVSSLVGGTEGTMFVEGFQNSPVTCVPFQLSDGTNNNRVQIEISSVGAPLCVVSSGGSTQAVIVGSSKAVGTNRKIAITFKANEFKLYENGQLIGTDTSGAIPVSLSAIYLGSESGNVYTGFTYKQILDFKTALTEAQCKELTAL
jgi:hypothetical protein